MSLRYESTVFETHDPERVARFWAGLLERQVTYDAAGLLVPGGGSQLSLRFVPSEGEQVRPNALHLHLTSTDLDDQRRQVQKALDLGGRHLDVGQSEDEGHVVLGDPEDNAFCVIEPGNSYLSGTGHLGEVTCDGTRAVGLFWTEALGWPLVWDQGEETAVQSPDGGTKISWSGTPASPSSRGQQHHRLVAPAGSIQTETDRLTRLGARLVGADGQDVRLTDPDGVVFVLSELD